MMKTHFVQLAEYNAWANARLYKAAAKLGSAAQHRDVGAYFTSLHGTLNHILVADQLWLARLQQKAPPHTTLDAIPHDDFGALHQARTTQDSETKAFIETLSDAEITSDFDYRDMGNTPRRLTRREILTHMFNHATHHRGQAHQSLCQLGITEPPALDLPYFLLGLD
jgi:uncharacterized damage-inducible protein DinB